MKTAFGVQRTPKVPCALMLLILAFVLDWRPAFAETVQILDRYITDRATIVGEFYQNKNQPLTLKISFGGIHGGASLLIICPEHEWDWDQIRKATKNLSQEINKSSTIDVFGSLKESGFDNCKFK